MEALLPPIALIPTVSYEVCAFIAGNKIICKLCYNPISFSDSAIESKSYRVYLFAKKKPGRLGSGRIITEGKFPLTN